MPKSISPADLPGLLAPGRTVYVPGMGGQSQLVVDALRANPAAAKGVTFTGVWLPGINRVDYAGLDPEAAADAFFFHRDLAASFAAGRVRFRPLSYFQTYRHLRDVSRIDLALLQVSPPDAAGRVSLGIANDFTPAILGKATVRVAHINPRMPRTRGAATVALADLDYVIEAEAPLLADNTGEDETWARIGRYLATVVPDGAVLEVGIGQTPQVLPALIGHRRLRMHTGAIMTPTLALVGSGALAEENGAIVTGTALGIDELYEHVADNPQVAFAPVGYTHDVGVLQRIERFTAINSVIEVDLWGEANAEMVDGRQFSSAGGIVDFMRGARLSPGGRAIVVLPATVKGGSVSRIVPRLAPGTTVSVARADMDTVITEFGVAELRNRTIDERAEALIGVAAPAFRDSLADAWAEMRRALAG
jgi:Acetyl-CoA hydrolase